MSTVMYYYAVGGACQYMEPTLCAKLPQPIVTQKIKGNYTVRFGWIVFRYKGWKDVVLGGVPKR